MHGDEDFAAAAGQGCQMSPTRLMLIDDHLMITEALASRLSASMDLWVAGRCTTGDPNLIDIVRGLRPDVIVIEVAPFGREIAEVLGQLMAARPEARVIVLTADHDVAHAVEAARAGVAAWVAKEQGAAELEAALRGVIKGESWFPPHMLGEILRELRADARRAGQQDGCLGMLSRREREVLLAMMDGKRGGQIAADLTISADTVRTHIRNIFAKLDVHSRLEAVRVARAAGLRAPGLSAPLAGRRAGGAQASSALGRAGGAQASTAHGRAGGAPTSSAGGMGGPGGTSGPAESRRREAAARSAAAFGPAAAT